MTAAECYDPRQFKALTFYDVTPHFRDGTDTPRAYLERCLETIAAREPAVQAFTALNESNARTAADASTERWQAGRPLSAIDGLPIGIKDLLETKGKVSANPWQDENSGTLRHHGAESDWARCSHHS